MTRVTHDDVLASMSCENAPWTAGEIAHALAIRIGERMPASYYKYIVKKRLGALVDSGCVVRFERSGPNGAHCYARSNP